MAGKVKAKAKAKASEILKLINGPTTEAVKTFIHIYTPRLLVFELQG